MPRNIEVEHNVHMQEHGYSKSTKCYMKRKHKSDRVDFGAALTCAPRNPLTTNNITSSVTECVHEEHRITNHQNRSLENDRKSKLIKENELLRKEIARIQDEIDHVWSFAMNT